MAVSHVEAVLEFLKKNGLSEAETALKEDMIEKGELGSFDFEKFFFPMVPPPRPLRIPSNHRRPEIAGSGESVRSNPRSEDDEFVSLGSSTSDGCSSGTPPSIEFMLIFVLTTCTESTCFLFVRFLLCFLVWFPR